MSDVGKVSLGLELDNNSGLGKQISSIAVNMGARFSQTLKSSMQSVMKGFKATNKPIPAPKVDVEAAQAEIEQLTAVLDNTNAKIELHQRKLAQLKESYGNTFNEARRNKIEEKIVNTEAALLRLTKQSDTTSSKIWKLEDSIKEVGDAANQTAPPVDNLDTKLKQTNKTLGRSGKQFKAAAKGAKVAGGAFLLAGRRAGKMGNQFTAAFQRIAKQVLVFAVLYKAIRGFMKYMGDSLKTNDQFAKSLNAIKTNLAVAFQPIFEAILPAINALMSGLAKVTTYIAAFMSSLFGTTYKKSYEAAKGLQNARKAMDGYGKSAKKAAGQLAAFDELNTLDTSVDKDGGGGGGSDWQMEMPEMDIDSIQAQTDKLTAGIKSAFDATFNAIKSGWEWTVDTFGPSFQAAWATVSPELDKWKESFRKMYADILTLGEPLKNWFTEHLVPFMRRGIEMAGAIWAGLLDSIRNVVNSIWDAVFPIISKFVTQGLPMLTEFLMGAQDIFMALFGIVKQVFDDIWQGVIDPVMQLISKIIQDALDIIFGWWDEWGKKIMAGLKEALDKIKELWTNLWNNFLKPFVDNMLKTLTWLWDKHLKGLIQEITNFIGKLVSAVVDIFNKFIMPIVNYLVKTLGPAFSNVFSLIGDVIGTALGVIADVAKGIIKALGGIIDFIAGVFTGEWKRAWEGIKTVFTGIFDAIVGVFKGAINLIIDALNWMIRQLNSFAIDIPDWVPVIGGESLGFSIPEIPKLAKGGLVSAPTLAMVGDNPGANVDPEVVAPLSKLQEMMGGGNQESVEVLYMILAALQEYIRRPIILEANGTQLARVVDDSRDDRNRRAGRTLSMT